LLLQSTPRILPTTDLPVTDPELDEGLYRGVLESVKPVATALTVVFLIFAVFNAFDLPEHAMLPVLVSDLVLALIFLAIRGLAAREAIQPRWAHAMLAGMAFLIVSNILLAFALLRDPFYTFYVLIIVVGGGFLLLSTRWLLLAVGVIAASWAVVAAFSCTPKQFLHYGFTMFGACVMSALVHMFRIRTLRRMELLRLANEHRKAEIEAALLSVEFELAERRLAETRYRDLVHGIDAVVWEAVREGWQFTFVSDHARELLGLPTSAWLDRPGFLLTRVHRDDRARAQTFLDAWQRGSHERQLECRLVRADDALVWVRLVVSPQRQVKPSSQLQGLIFDISKQKEEERERRDLQEQLQQSQKMEAIGTLAGGVAHDINNMLAAIMGLAGILRDSFETDSIHTQDVDDILAACRRGHDLTQNLLGFARRGKVRKMRLSLNTAVEEVVELLQRTISPRIEVKQELAESLGKVEGDPAQLNHVLVNLALNAADAMQGRGTLTFATRNVILDASVPDVKPGRYVSVQVTDTGTGMDEKTLEHAFDPFFTTKAPGEGTGLGLSMVYGTVQNHGGRVFIESEPGKGTTVTIQLPQIEGEKTDVRADTALPDTPLPSKTILVVDDEALLRTSARRQLLRLGHRVILARDGIEAVEIYEKRGHEIDLVLLDVLMPRMDGHECYDKLKAIDPEVQVLFTSGYTNPDESLPGAPHTGFLSKPYSFERLSTELARMFSPQVVEEKESAKAAD
jgi:PAS domain S-box-containing protein